MRKMSKNAQVKSNGGLTIYCYRCGGCGWYFKGPNRTFCELQHGIHLSTKFGKKCMGKGLYKFPIGVKIW